MPNFYSFSKYKHALTLLWASPVVSGKESAYNAGDTGDVSSGPGSGRSPGEGSGNPLQYSCLENSMDRGAYRATVHGVTKSQTQQNTHTHTQLFL